MSENKLWPIDEFVSFELKEDKKKEEFTIILKGKLKFSDLLAFKIGEIEITEKDLKEYLE